MITFFPRAPAFGEIKILNVTRSKSRAERFPAHLKLKLFKAAVTGVGSRPERSSHTHSPRVHSPRRRLIWSKVLVTAIRRSNKDPPWKGCDLKRVRREKEKKNNIKTLKRGKQTVKKLKRYVNQLQAPSWSEEIPRLSPERATGQRGLLEGATWEIKDPL